MWVVWDVLCDACFCVVVVGGFMRPPGPAGGPIAPRTPQPIILTNPPAQTHTQTKKVVPKRIVLYGRSIGSGPSCYLAERLSRDGTPVGGLILQVICFLVCFFFFGGGREYCPTVVCQSWASL